MKAKRLLLLSLCPFLMANGIAFPTEKEVIDKYAFQQTEELKITDIQDVQDYGSAVTKRITIQNYGDVGIIRPKNDFYVYQKDFAFRGSMSNITTPLFENQLLLKGDTMSFDAYFQELPSTWDVDKLSTLGTYYNSKVREYNNPSYISFKTTETPMTYTISLNEGIGMQTAKEENKEAAIVSFTYEHVDYMVVLNDDDSFKATADIDLSKVIIHGYDVYLTVNSTHREKVERGGFIGLHNLFYGFGLFILLPVLVAIPFIMLAVHMARKNKIKARLDKDDAY